MTEACNFQNLNIQCLRSCLETGCTLNLLMNSKCDSECNSNICGWDYGECGYCAKDCFIIDIENCPSSCNVPECLNNVFCIDDIFLTSKQEKAIETTTRPEKNFVCFAWRSQSECLFLRVVLKK